MSLSSKKALYDGFTTLNGGANSGQSPNVIAPNQYWFGRNVTARGGFVTTRPGWRKRVLTFDSATAQGRFEDALFQGAYGFEPLQGGLNLVSSHGGRIFKIDVLDQFKTNELSSALTVINSATLEKSWMEQAEDFLVIQDNQSSPLIYDGSSLRRVSPTSIPREVPVGNVMTYANGRLAVARPNGRSFVVGNIVYGEDGTEGYGGRDAVLKFTENDFLNEGGEFSVPFNAGSIRAMRAIAILDTSLGQGPVQVMTERGGFSFNAPFDRTQWKNLTYPIQTVSLLGSGAESHEAAILVNGDLWFRASDGIRSYQVARRDFGSWVNTPLSSEMQEVIKDDSVHLLDHASAILFDNRYLVTAAPERVHGHGTIWKGVIALDFHNVSGIGARSAPVYDGLWTGLNILQIVPLADRCFMYVLNASDKIELWELTRDDEFDNLSTRIAAFIDTRSFGFNDTGWNLKRLYTGDLWFDALVGTVDFNVKFAPDQYPCPLAWHSWSIDSKNKSCLTGVCEAPASLHPQYRPRMQLPTPAEACTPKSELNNRLGYEFSLRIAWTGHARLKKLRLVAHEVQEDTLPACESSESTDTTGVACCDDSLFSYSSG